MEIRTATVGLMTSILVTGTSLLKSRTKIKEAWLPDDVIPAKDSLSMVHVIQEYLIKVTALRSVG